MRVTGGRCCRRGRLMSSSSIGRRAAIVAMCLARRSGSRRVSLRATRSRAACDCGQGQRASLPACPLPSVRRARRPGQLPQELAGSHLGPRLQAAIATVSVRNRVSRRDAVELDRLTGSGAERYEPRLRGAGLGSASDRADGHNGISGRGLSRLRSLHGALEGQISRRIGSLCTWVQAGSTVVLVAITVSNGRAVEGTYKGLRSGLSCAGACRTRR